MRILLTRPREDAETLAPLIEARGHTAIIEPLIEIKVTPGPALDLAHVRALVLTSANAVRAAARRTPNRSIPVWAVGPATAAQAKAMGFNVSQSPGQGVDGLAHHIRQTLDPKEGPLLHLTGTAVAGNLAGALTPLGFQILSQKIYEATPLELLPHSLADQLNAGRIDAAMFFSPRTATAFAALLSRAGLVDTCAGMTALTLSPSVAKSLEMLTFRKVLVAQNTTTDAMLSLVDTL